MSKRELFSSPIAKRDMEHAGSIQIDRADPSPSPIKFAVELLRAGELLLIFPAGMRVFVSQQKRGVTPAIKRELKRRSAVEPVIGHLKSDHRMDRNFLIRSEGDAANASLAAVGYNFARLLGWLRELWRDLLVILALLTLQTQRPAAT